MSMENGMMRKNETREKKYISWLLRFMQGNYHYFNAF